MTVELEVELEVELLELFPPVKFKKSVLSSWS